MSIVCFLGGRWAAQLGRARASGLGIGLGQVAPVQLVHSSCLLVRPMGRAVARNEQLFISRRVACFRFKLVPIVVVVGISIVPPSATIHLSDSILFSTVSRRVQVGAGGGERNEQIIQMFINHDYSDVISH